MAISYRVTDQYSNGKRQTYEFDTLLAATDVFYSGQKIIDEHAGCVVGLIGVRIDLVGGIGPLWHQYGRFIDG